MILRSLSEEFPLPILLSREAEEAASVLNKSLREGRGEDVPDLLSFFFQALFFTVHKRVEAGRAAEQDPIWVFLIVNGLNKDGAFLPCKLMTPSMSHLQYWMRLVGLEKVHKLAEDNESLFKYVYCISGPQYLILFLPAQSPEEVFSNVATF